MFTPAENLVPSESLLERRFYPRVSPAGLVRIAFAGDNIGTLLNLSENGLLVSTPLALVQNFVCRISLLLNGLAKPVDVWLRVVWTSDSHRSGLQLLDLCDPDREQLRKWAAMQDPLSGEAEPAQSEPSGIAPLKPEERATHQQKTVKTPSSRGPLLPSALAAVLVLAGALVLRGNSLRDLLSHFLKASAGAGTAKAPGTAIHESPKPQATELASAASSDPRPAPVDPAPLTAAPPALADQTTIAATNETVAAPTHPPSSPAKTAPSPPVTTLAKSTTARIRNRSLLEASKHFGNQYIGHLDLAGSNKSDGQSIEPAPQIPAPPNVAAATTSPNGTPPDAAKPTSATHAVPPQRSSAITGSIAHDPAFGQSSNRDEDVPSWFAAAPNNTAAAPTPITTSSPDNLAAPDAKPSPANPPADPNPAPPRPTPRNSAAPPIGPQNHTLQLTLPISARASYINLPGEQVLQSPAITLHIQRAILAPASPAATNTPRTATVTVGDLLSHSEPQPPHLTQETGTRVAVRAFLTADGRVERLMPVNGSVALVSSAARAVRQWQFQPTLLAGKPVPTAVYVLVEFHPEANGSARP